MWVWPQAHEADPDRRLGWFRGRICEHWGGARGGVWERRSLCRAGGVAGRGGACVRLGAWLTGEEPVPG